MHKIFLIILIYIVSGLAHASKTTREVIYGPDNRDDFFEIRNPQLQELSLSTLAMVKKEHIKIQGETAKLLGPTVGERFQLCEKERFVHQPSIASCSGFLVAEDIVATAGHCMDEEGDCTNFSWVFNYKIESEGADPTEIRTSDIFQCAKIIKSKVDNTGLDFALIKLNRPVTAYKPVKIAKKTVPLGTPLVLIGHPSGLPQKIADGAEVKRTGDKRFKANLDSFQINSGSAVFNELNGELLGILVNGKRDYRENSALGCTEANILPDDEGGEGVSSFEQFLPYL